MALVRCGLGLHQASQGVLAVLRGDGGGGSAEVDRGIATHRQRQLRLVFV